MGTVVDGAVQRLSLEEDPADLVTPSDEEEDVPVTTPQDVESDGDGDGAEAHERRLARERKLKAPDRASTAMDRLKNIKQRHRPEPVKQQKWVEGRVYTSLCRYKFARVVLDEAHVIRNPRTLLAEALLQTQKRNIHFLSATALLNHAQDLRGYLFQIFNQDWKLVRVRGGFLPMYDPNFDPLKVQEDGVNPQFFSAFPDESTKVPGQQELWRAHKAGVKLYLLDPVQYLVSGRRNEWSAEVCAKIMPPILEMLQLKIGYETDIEDGVGGTAKVGEAIPLYDFYTVQLAWNPLEKRLHDDYTLHMLAALGAGDPGSTMGADTRTAKTRAEMSGLEDPADGEGSVHSGVYRYLKHGTMDPRLCVLTELNHRDMSALEKAKAAKERKNNWTDHDIDHGASMFFLKTRDGPQYGTPTDRLNMARYLCAFSPKMRFAFGIIAETLELEQKIVLVFEYPMTLW